MLTLCSCFHLIQAEKGVPERKYTDLATLVSEYLNRGTQNGLVYALKHPVEVQETADTDSGMYDNDGHDHDRGSCQKISY